MHRPAEFAPTSREFAPNSRVYFESLHLGKIVNATYQNDDHKTRSQEFTARNHDVSLQLRDDVLRNLLLSSLFSSLLSELMKQFVTSPTMAGVSIN